MTDEYTKFHLTKFRDIFLLRSDKFFVSMWSLINFNISYFARMETEWYASVIGNSMMSFILIWVRKQCAVQTVLVSWY